MLRREDEVLAFHHRGAFLQADPFAAVKGIEKHVFVPGEEMAGQADAIDLDPGAATDEHVNQRE